MATISIDGFDDVTRLARDLSTTSRAALPLARAAVTKTAADITADAQAVAPVDTGDLRRSIGYTVTATDGAVTADVGPTVDYGAYVEFGTSRQSPQPYLTPAFERRTPALDAALTAAANRLAGG